MENKSNKRLKLRNNIYKKKYKYITDKLMKIIYWTTYHRKEKLKISQAYKYHRYTKFKIYITETNITDMQSLKSISQICKKYNK